MGWPNSDAQIFAFLTNNSWANDRSLLAITSNEHIDMHSYLGVRVSVRSDPE